MKSWPVYSAITISSFTAPIAMAAPIDRMIRFDVDATSAVVSGTIKAGQEIDYHVPIGNADQMVVRLAPSGAPIDFAVYTPGKKKALAASLQGPDVRCADYGMVQSPGIYVIAITGGDANYTLTVNLKNSFSGGGKWSELKKCPPDSYPSPDGSLIAQNDDCGEPESEIQILKPNKLSVYQKTSPDVRAGQGWPVEYAAWTPDSKFFVFNTTSSGGHGPWHAPTYFYSREDNKIYSLDDRIGAVESSNVSHAFSLKAPDVIQVTIHDSPNDRDFSDSLSSILKKPKPNP